MPSEPADAAPAPDPAAVAVVPSAKDLLDLYRLGDIGYVRGVREKLTEIAKQSPETVSFIESLEGVVSQLDLPRYMAILKTLLEKEPG